MAIPELYRYGREGTHFGLGMFSWYMLDAVVQVGGCHLSVSLFVGAEQPSGGDRVLHHDIFILTDNFETRWLRNCDVRVFGNHGSSNSDDRQSLQWSQHNRMDRLGILCRFLWYSARLGIYGTFHCHRQ
jgi:hypothetical protein